MARSSRARANRPYHPHQLGIDDPDHVIWGIFVGSCVDERLSQSIWENARSHAHNYTKDPWFGWICVVSPKDALTKSGKPTDILIHEIAHLMCPNQFHSPKWKRTVVRMGAGAEIERRGLKPLR